MTAYLAEFIGTATLVFLGDSVVANVCLKKTKGSDSGFLVIAIGWAMAVFIPVIIFGEISGAHLNPAITIAKAISGSFNTDLVLGYIICQLIGGFVGAIMVYVFYKDHFDVTEDQETKLCVFCTAPAIKNLPRNFISEFLATFVLMFAIMGLSKTNHGSGFSAVSVSAVILAIGVSLGGTTGYAINPARDLGPRLAHFILPIKNKGKSMWSYSAIPVVGPILGGMAAALAFVLLY